MSPAALAKLIKRSIQRTFKRHIEEREERIGRTVICRRVNGKVKRQIMKREKTRKKSKDEHQEKFICLNVTRTQ
jgi:siroheme synthase (precorrin-2 oxidase/ferrochelatase)